VSKFGDLFYFNKIANSRISNVLIAVDSELIHDSDEKDKYYKALRSDVKTMNRDK
jgi:hypothetical protein